MFINRVLMIFAIAGGLLILGTGVAGQPSVIGAPSTAQSIVGSWLAVPTGVPGQAPGTPSLITFTADGNILFSSGIASSSGGHGTWARTGDHTVAETYLLIRHNAAGDFIGTAKVRATLTLNATFDGYTGSGRADQFDTQGTLVRSINVTGRATRIRVESP